MNLPSLKFFKKSNNTSLAFEISYGLIRSFSLLTVIAISTAIFSYWILKNRIEKYTCNYLSTTSELIGYQVGRELALKNTDVAEKLTTQYSQSIQSIVPGKLQEFSILKEVINDLNDQRWTCSLGFNQISFKRKIEFGQLDLGEIYGKIEIFKSWSFFAILFSLFTVGSLFIYTLGKYIYRMFNHKILSPLEAIVNSNFDIISSDLSIEVRIIASRIIESHNKLMDIEKKLSLIQSQAELANLAAQVSHDIRSPVTALNMILSSLEMMPEQQRILLRSSITRINDIANSLLERGKKKSSMSSSLSNPFQVSMVSSLIDSVVSEKRLFYRDKNNIKIEVRLQNSYGLFVFIDPVEMTRLLSNAIDNAFDACRDRLGLIEVILESVNNSVIITVKDNGKGIPSCLLKTLGEMGVTYGKEGSQSSGTGLGVYHAKKTIESFGGRYEINSIEGHGTSVIITLRKEQSPDWFVQNLSLKMKQIIVAIDDDRPILELWKQRFKLFIENDQIDFISFTSGKDFRAWIYNNEEAARSAKYLVDYEIFGESKNGLNIIEELNLQQQAILVTSRYDESEVKVKCLKLGVKLIPKMAVPLIPISLD